jgi:hypothetical protein
MVRRGGQKSLSSRLSTKQRVQADFSSRPFPQPISKTLVPDLPDLRRFLAGCKYVSDEEQFGERDYWQPPELFEECRKGDCEDFALWAWRQLLHLNYPARFVLGKRRPIRRGTCMGDFSKRRKNVFAGDA